MSKSSGTQPKQFIKAALRKKLKDKKLSGTNWIRIMDRLSACDGIYAVELRDPNDNAHQIRPLNNKIAAPIETPTEAELELERKAKEMAGIGGDNELPSSGKS